ncbi:hypothetical protein DEU56DRAFT_793024 [Suillus clintonianus]|uniref:uncharacterized protein n=1 Tax=Suillus clintonianus TaxID=1904413 RepID=UPI001B87AE1D|nr:uncharacterized protein DEU56DRAFT_793024 [Suillus clintonianus]KAG2143022.1 hypothetical protein DEU56DRAFT_793024 [Suillus clintonianus]
MGCLVQPRFSSLLQLALQVVGSRCCQAWLYFNLMRGLNVGMITGCDVGVGELENFDKSFVYPCMQPLRSVN